MVSAENVSRAAELLRLATSRDATDPEERLERGLLIAAALREVFGHEPVVVGGTAEDFWTADEYHPTDLDLVTWPLTDDERGVLDQLGFTREGRHWVHDGTGVPVEFPDTRLAGDEARIHRHRVETGVASIIGVEYLYLDRVRQSTIDPDDVTLPTYLSALAIGASNHDRIDWRYVDAAIRGETEVDPKLMRKIHRRVRRAIAERFQSGSSS